jgi:CDP-diacylglycerol--glycerol-3-phosphate 3-phosphatidyltransferase
MEKILKKIASFFEEIDEYRDKLLFIFIKPHWPKKITPNHITYVRVVIGILLCIFLFFFNIENKLLILVLFFAGVITDFIDGPVARGTNRVTEFGAMLDSTADRILIVPIAFYSLFQSEKWLLLALILMEVVNAISSLFYKSKEIYLESNIFGKIKMTIQAVVFIAILFFWPAVPSGFFLNMLWLSIIFGILSIFSRILDLKNKRYARLKNI